MYGKDYEYKVYSLLIYVLFKQLAAIKIVK